MIATKILINDPRKAKYAEFYKYVYHFQQQFDAKNWVANLILF